MDPPYKGESMTTRAPAIALLVALGCLYIAGPAIAEERTVVGTIESIDPAARTFTIRDGKGAAWRYKADRGAGIDLEPLRVGDRVSVTIARGTPLNMMTAADILRKGDTVRRIPY